MNNAKESNPNRCLWCKAVFPPYVILVNGLCGTCNDDVADMNERGIGDVIDTHRTVSQSSVEREPMRAPLRRIYSKNWRVNR